MASYSSSALRSLSRASRSTWSSDVDRRPRAGAPSCVTTRRTSPPWTCSLFRVLASTCSMPLSSFGWPAETLSGSTSQPIRPRTGSHARSRRHSLGMSNCHLVAGRSLIDLVASRLALRAPALRAATALTRPNRSAQRLPCGRRTAPTAVTVDPSRTVAEHGVERGDHLTHHRHDDDLRLLSGGLEAIVECFECRIPITSAQRGHVEHVADARATTPDATASFELLA